MSDIRTKIIYRLADMKAIYNFIQEKRIKRNAKKRRVGFLCQYIPAWNKTKLVYDSMKEDERFEVFLICIPSGNHDTARLAPLLQGDELKIAFAFLLTMPGAPFLYYGDEIGMLGNKNSGEIFKLSFPWAKGDPLQTTRLDYWNIYGKKPDKSDYTQPFEEQNVDPDSVLSAIRTLIHIRCENEALFKGRFEGFTAADNITSYKMVSEHQEAVMLHNMRDETVKFKFDVTGYKLLYMTYHFCRLPFV